MITYVNTVLVSNKNNAAWATAADLKGTTNKASLQNLVGKFAFMNCDPAKQDGSPITDIYAYDADADTFKLGVIKDSFISKWDRKNKQMVYIPNVKWSNEIKVADIKSLTVLTYMDDTEDKVIVDLNPAKIDPNTYALLQGGGIPVVLRLTFKDMPTRYRNWTESYDYVTKPGDTSADIVAGLAETIVRQSRRARVEAAVNGNTLELTAMPYTDDDAKDSENLAAKVRFNANMWYSNPQAAGFASNNKYPLGEISKSAGVQYPASAKLVRDRERLAHGYEGILHNEYWYDPKPAMVADITNKYNGLTLEFENMYRAADDIFRKTKQTVELYASNNGEPSTFPATIAAQISAMIDSRQKIVNPVDNKEAYDHTNF